MPDKYNEVLDEMLESAKALRRRAEAAELKQARAGLTKDWTNINRYAGSERQTMNLTDTDHKFLSYLRGQEKPDNLKALVSDNVGEVLISPTIDMAIQRDLEKLVVIRGLAAKRTITGDRILMRDITESAVAWKELSLGAEIAETDLVPGEAKYCYLENLWGLTKLSENVLADSDFNLAVIIADSFARKIAESEERGFVRGRGHETHEEPEGIITNTVLLENATQTSAPGVVTFEDIMDLTYSVPAMARKGASFVMHSKCELQLRKLRSRVGDVDQGNFLWSPSLAADLPNRLLGYPCYVCDEFDEPGSGGIIAAFGSWQQGYRIIEKGGMSVKVLDQTFAEAGLVGYRVHARVGGSVIRPENKVLALLQDASE